jgi:hypothetical protein
MSKSAEELCGKMNRGKKLNVNKHSSCWYDEVKIAIKKKKIYVQRMGKVSRSRRL